MRRLVIAALVAAALVVAGAAGGAAIFRAYPVRTSLLVAMSRNYLRSWSAPKGCVATELNPAYKRPAAAAPSLIPATADAGDGDWPSYNRTLTSERYAPLAEINARTVGKLKVLCTYDTGQYSSFESGLIMVNGALIGTTMSDIFSLDPATCAENWRTREDVPPSILSAMRGAAYLDGMLYRGSQDGRVLAYDFKTGKRVWATTIADASRGEFVSAAPIAWNGLVFIGNAGGDAKGGKGHMFALDAKTGKIVWEFFLVPKTEGDHGARTRGRLAARYVNLEQRAGNTDQRRRHLGVLHARPGCRGTVRAGRQSRAGLCERACARATISIPARSSCSTPATGAYKRHFKLVQRDWHDWDVASAPSLIKTAGGKELMAAAPKDGYLYGVDLAENAIVYRVPVTRIENVDAPFSVDAEVRFCPGAVGGAEWNGPAYDPQTNLILTGETEWCTTVKLQTEQQMRDVRTGGVWFGMATRNPFHILGRQDDGRGAWGGWVYAVDADTGVWKWRLKSNYPIVGGMTPTAGGLVFFGDVGGNFYALDAATGEKLWGQKIGGAIGGGVIAYNGRRRREDRRGDRSHRRLLAHRGRDRQDRGARARRRTREAMRP